MQKTAFIKKKIVSLQKFKYIVMKSGLKRERYSQTFRCIFSETIYYCTENYKVKDFINVTVKKLPDFSILREQLENLLSSFKCNILQLIVEDTSIKKEMRVYLYASESYKKDDSDLLLHNIITSEKEILNKKEDLCKKVKEEGDILHIVSTEEESDFNFDEIGLPDPDFVL